MSIINLIFWSIILYTALQFITARYLVQVEDPPKAVGVAGLLEAVFGTMVWGALWFPYPKYERFIGIFVMFLGLFWICVAVSLYKGSKVGRTICLILSILRIPTIIGAFFSAFSLYLLYVPQKSKDFFNKVKQQEETKTEDA